MTKPVLEPVLEPVSQPLRSTENVEAPVPPGARSGEYWVYSTDEPRRETGCIGGRMPQRL